MPLNRMRMMKMKNLIPMMTPMTSLLMKPSTPPPMPTLSPSLNPRPSKVPRSSLNPVNGRRVVGSRWHFKVKRNADGSIEHFKARLVAKGYSQHPGFDFTGTFAPTVHYSAVRAILALAALEDMEIHSLDVSNAYLNGVLEEEIYMQLPEGFEDLGKPGDVLLNKALYGLKQAGRVWFKTLADTLSKMGFIQIKSDPSIYVFLRDTLRIIIPVFVDDMTLISKSKPAIQAFIKELSTHFKLRDLGSTTQLLGIKIDRDRPSRTISLSQGSISLTCWRGMGCLTANLSPPLCPLASNSPPPWLPPPLIRKNPDTFF